MKFPGGFDMNSMMKQAQKMQEQMGKEMKQMTVDASAGGGAVSVKMRGDFEVLELIISPDLVKDGDTEMIQDLAVAALNEARRKVEESLKGKLGGMLPPGLDFNGKSVNLGNCEIFGFQLKPTLPIAKITNILICWNIQNPSPS